MTVRDFADTVEITTQLMEAEMQDFAKNMTNQDLIEIVRAMDNAAKPLSRRFEGDDDALTSLMHKLGCKQTLADKLLITGEVLRECAHRGIQIPRSN